MAAASMNSWVTALAVALKTPTAPNIIAAVVTMGLVIEANVTDFVLSQAKVTEKTVSFEELMGQG